MARREREFFNGLGGFANDGGEYVVTLGEGQSTPAPWINVIANASFGFQVSVEGAGYTWSVNSKENQITQWSNDPVGDRPARSSIFATPIATSCGVRRPRRFARMARHTSLATDRATAFSSTARGGVALELTQYVPVDDSIKISRLKIRNLSARPRRLSVTAYVEWVLGTARGAFGAIRGHRG